ncbi:MAG TPA: macro domain-containing protein [Polyangia bacterium]|nr:macro domain-containing protein [Polyangia bacterium]
MNLFESPAQTLVNTVNTVGIMGKGIAAEYKKRYPEMFHRYAEFCANGTLTTGKLYLYRSPNKWVLNFPTKHHWRNPSKVEYIEEGLKKFVATWAEYGITSISFPQLGTGNGGLDWKKDVQPLMERYLKDLPLAIYIHVTKNRSNFVPEHKNAISRKQLLKPRVSVSFNEFLSDLSEHARGVEPVASNEAGREEPEPLPRLRCSDDLTIAGEDLRSLWLDLTLRGALRIDEFPASLKEHLEVVTSLLLQLGYIRPAQFTGNSERNVKGIRFVPAADESPESIQPMTPELEALGR